MNELNKEEIEYIEQAEGIIWRLATVVKANIETLEKIDKQIEHQLPHLRVNIEDAILLQMRTYQKINELFPRLEEIEEVYIQKRSNPSSTSHKAIKLYAPRIWNIINIVSKLKPASLRDSRHKNFEADLAISVEAKYTAINEEKNKLSFLDENNHKLTLRGNKNYTDYLKTVGISGQIGQIAILEPIVTSSNLVLKKD